MVTGGEKRTKNVKLETRMSTQYAMLLSKQYEMLHDSLKVFCTIFTKKIIPTIGEYLRAGIVTSFLVMFVSFYPSFSIQTFYVPPLNGKFMMNQTTLLTSDADSLVFFNLELQNTMWYKGVLYGPVNLTFSYAAANASAVPFATYRVSDFYQGRGKTARRRDVVVASGDGGWREAAMSALSSGSTADFRVDLDTKVKFNNYLWYTWKKRIVSHGIVKVGDSGRTVGNKPVKLTNSALPFTTLLGNIYGIGSLVLLWFYVIGGICSIDYEKHLYDYELLKIVYRYLETLFMLQVL
ncbi:hypothetical protein CDL12_14735 [Handroanthus impetiginosus]|uniref:Late embryogenesis abundant protein LEA-2 subgroup domain-containing protein n=1 Tax=Handroanthus impetiginosus TaxID=429701 RepID=A0A2G9H559_9LAMI|nr:hypothetical protein CDL12_14735 [Handroanthus impetiginosus]